jgi:uncharacterized sporulation protein YeaH/YhbH (DUF444 family)
MANSWIVDRRNDAQNKSVINRQRFMRRYQDQIRKAVDQAIGQRSIKEMEQETTVPIPKKTLSEPTFRHSGDGAYDVVQSGNDHYHTGDREPKPQGGGGKGSGSGSGAGNSSDESTDDFLFTLTKEEFLQLFFDDLELPNLERSSFHQIQEKRYVKAGYSKVGSPANLSIRQTVQRSLARQLALKSVLDKEIKECILRLEENPDDMEAIDKLHALKQQVQAIPFIDDRDVRYRHREVESVPSTRAVMFCLMDVSGSMQEHHKDLAKRFFTLLYLFLERKYERIDIRFIRHTNVAEEVDEHSFFNDPRSGGTTVMSGMLMIDEIVERDYHDGTWNIYGAQASDGDAFGDDGRESASFLEGLLLPKMQFFSYIEVAEEARHKMHTAPQATSLWKSYQALERASNFSMRRVENRSEIYPALRGLFERKPTTRS